MRYLRITWIYDTRMKGTQIHTSAYDDFDMPQTTIKDIYNRG